MRTINVTMSMNPTRIVVDEKNPLLKTSELILLRQTILTRCNAWRDSHKDAEGVKIVSGDNYNDILVDSISENQKRELYGYLMSNRSAFDDVAMDLEQVD